MVRTTSKDAYKDLPQTHINRQEKAILKYVMSRIDACRISGKNVWALSA